MTHDEILAKVREARTICDGEPWGFIRAARTGWPEALDLLEEAAHHIHHLEAMADNWRTLYQQEASTPLPPNPPPGKMRVTASVPVTYDVSPGQIAAYLRANGMEDIAPQRADQFTTDLWAQTMLPCLARHEGRSTGEVLRDIAAMEES